MFSFKILRFLFLIAVVALPCEAITRHGTCSGTTSCTLSAASAGDLQIAIAVRQSNATKPSCASGWVCPTTSWGTQFSNFQGVVGTCTSCTSYTIGCRISSTTASGTWGNASGVRIVSYSSTFASTGACMDAINVSSAVFASSATTSFTCNTLTPKNTDGNSWVLCLGVTSSSICATPPTGLTAAVGSGTAIIYDTNGGVSSWSTNSCTVTSERVGTLAIEVLPLEAWSGGWTQTGKTCSISSGTFPNTCTWSTTPTAGDDIICELQLTTAGTFPTNVVFTNGTGGAQFTQLGSFAVGTSVMYAGYLFNIQSPATTIAAAVLGTAGTGSINQIMGCADVQGSAFVSPIDKITVTTFASHAAGLLSGTALTTTNSNELVVTIVANTGGVTIGPGWKALPLVNSASTSSNGGQTAITAQVQASAGSFTPSVFEQSNSDNVAMWGVAFSLTNISCSGKKGLTLVSVGAC